MKKAPEKPTLRFIERPSAALWFLLAFVIAESLIFTLIFGD